MASLNSYHYYTTTSLLIVLLLHNFLSLVSASNHPHTAISPRVSSNLSHLCFGFLSIISLLQVCVNGLTRICTKCVCHVQELLFEEKNRLGSIPPSCHNKCNDCHPCMAVQVPTLPSHDSNPPDLTKTSAMATFFNPSSPQGNRYSNYKPLGWKCHCGDHFFNP